MLFQNFTLSHFYMIAGFLLSMYSCVANDIIQTLGTFLSANKKTPFIYLWIFSAAIMIITIVTGWALNNGDMSFGLLNSIPFNPNMSWIYLLPPIALWVLTKYGVPVASTFLILSVFSISNMDVFVSILVKSILGYVIAFFAAIIIYNILARPLERYFYYTQKRSGNNKISKWWMAAKWFSTAFIWSQWLMQILQNFLFICQEERYLVQIPVRSDRVLLPGPSFYRQLGQTVQKSGLVCFFRKFVYHDISSS